MTFDMEATFGDDYLYFYEDSIDDDHSDADTGEILGLMDLPAGSRILDAPCGHGRIARRLAAAGMNVTGVDLTAAYLAQARADAKLLPNRSHTWKGTSATSRSTGRSTRSCAGSIPSGTTTTRTVIGSWRSFTAC